MKRLILFQMIAACMVAFLFAFTQAFAGERLSNLLIRFIFWLLLILPIWLSVASSNFVIIRKLALPLHAGFFVNISTSFFISIPATGWVWFLHHAFGLEQESFAFFFTETLVLSLLISSSVWTIIHLRMTMGEQDTASYTAQNRQDTDHQNHTSMVEFMKRLPRDKRGELIAITAADHYVEIHTDKGHTLIRMRMKDALLLLPKDLGIQIHRSCWVALDAAAQLIRKDNKIFLRLKNGKDYRVSKNYLRKTQAHFK